MDLYEEGKQDMCSDGPSNTLQNNSTSNRAGCLGTKQIFQAMNHCHIVPIIYFEFTLKSVTNDKDILALLKITHSNSTIPKIVCKLKKKFIFLFFSSKLAAVAVWSFGLLFKKYSTFLTPSHLDH